ncbi:MAG: pyridoxal-5-phosphate-dependent protein subunit beta, partial [Acidimicrobiia bacterium]|nr:pyridoxal-5-phosphate-dependent protein subunit beta [Acidimicrobiia bacterium]
EALQCPTILYNGYGEHRIEGIGDKHIPWVHNVKNSDMAIGVDDEAAMALTRLFNEEAGLEYLSSVGVDDATIEHLPLMGISGAANLLSAIKVAKHYEMTEKDVVMTVATDSMEMYGSRLAELTEDRGSFDATDAAVAFNRYLLGTGLDHVHELGYYDRKRIHNLKYYTWVEQQGKTYEEIQAQWYDDDYWTSIQAMADPIDELIGAFNERVASQ